jgi:hypothetical protein
MSALFPPTHQKLDARRLANYAFACPSAHAPSIIIRITILAGP